MSVNLAETAEDVSRIAFGFMASKALFAGLHLGVFTFLADGPKTVTEVSGETGVPESRVTILMTALTTIGLIDSQDGSYANSPGASAFLARGAKYDFGDYLRFQIDRQMYPFLGQLNEVLDGSLDPDAVDSYQHWMSDPMEAALYSNAQHSGSLGPGGTIARLVDLVGARTLLDVGGGTGAMTIRLLEANPDLQSTIIDFPNVAEIGEGFIADAGLSDRVRYIASNALDAEWPTGQDVILMSYLFSGVAAQEVPRLLQGAFDCLSPGGRLLVHNFMVDDDRTGPPMASLWQLQHMAFTPDVHALTPGWLMGRMEQVGFTDIQNEKTIPGLTRLIHARKAA
ncbi:MAG: methyltransferase [Alphaproteobacteria bacterium]|jgi:2-hydroxy-4-(methylsulfanyl)butanoate S-methyltransferase|nr:methyltransferase [Alphaproteobacteria bacterium]MBT7942274.1 methyltransferase [Alphaproteobacteria bacterium]